MKTASISMSRYVKLIKTEVLKDLASTAGNPFYDVARAELERRGRRAKHNAQQKDKQKAKRELAKAS